MATSLACLAAVRASGVEPDVVVGHSVGEYAALAASGALDTAGAVGLCRERGLATAEAAAERPGAMAAVLGLEDGLVEELCAEVTDVWPANYNCPGQLVVSGATEAVERVLELARERGARRTITLKVTGAFHSPLVESAGARLRPALEAAELARAGVAVPLDGDGGDRDGHRAAPGAARQAADDTGSLHPGRGEPRGDGRRHVRGDRPRPGSRRPRAAL